MDLIEESGTEWRWRGCNSRQARDAFLELRVYLFFQLLLFWLEPDPI
jgi:hypothetical protein